MARRALGHPVQSSVPGQCPELAAVCPSHVYSALWQTPGKTFLAMGPCALGPLLTSPSPKQSSDHSVRCPHKGSPGFLGHPLHYRGLGGKGVARLGECQWV